MKGLLMIIVAVSSISGANTQSALLGSWVTGENNTIIETYKKEDAWYGKIISSDNPKAIIGTNILWELKIDGDKWKGKIYAAKRDKVLNAEITPSSSSLNITVFAGFMKKKVEWKRVVIEQ